VIAPHLEEDPPPALPSLASLGAFASPTCGGPPRQAAGALARSLAGRIGRSALAFEGDFARQCERLAALAGAHAVRAQLLQSAPGGGGWAASAEAFHVDLDPRDPAAERLRRVRVYVGAGTEWIHPADEPPGWRGGGLAAYRAAMAAIAARPPPIRQVGAGRVISYRGGLARGLVHRGPGGARLILVVDAPTARPL